MQAKRTKKKRRVGHEEAGVCGKDVWSLAVMEKGGEDTRNPCEILVSSVRYLAA